MKSVLITLSCLCVLLTPAASFADEPLPPPGEPAAAPERHIEVLGFARAIPRSRSASRDAPGFGVMMAPRGIRTASAEFAVVTIPAGPLTIRPGFYGLIELEGDRDSAEFTLWPSQEIHFWRASYALPVAVSFDSWAQALCGRCMLEASIQFRHESEHYTGHNGGGAARDYADRPIYGDAIGLDAAASLRRGDFMMLSRLAVDLFLPARSSYSVGPSVDVHVRYVAWRGPQPFFSGYAQYREGTETSRYGYPSAYLLRGLLGVAFTSSLGDVMLFASGDVGHRMGLAAYTREATLGFGVRLALGPLPSS
jgi:hypothetical protein